MNKFLFIVNSLADLADECDKRGCYEESDKLTNVLSFLSNIAEISKTALKKEAKVVEVQRDGKTKYEVQSESNKDWSGGIFDTREEAEKRLRQVEYFKHK